MTDSFLTGGKSVYAESGFQSDRREPPGNIQHTTETSPMFIRRILTPVFFIAAAFVHAEDFAVHTFQRQQLNDVYFSEGANAADVNADGVADVVYGPYWFEGPAFEVKHEIYEAVPQNRDRYA
ncbi:MAG: hypothetical protein KDA89_12610, partial [Planctomycetaceae bacterium]|nr:hypothetical protein [Planctomycetaceae bacterium]